MESGGTTIHAKRLVHDLDMGSFQGLDKFPVIAVIILFI
jgi:hypothetical protein